MQIRFSAIVIAALVNILYPLAAQAQIVRRRLAAQDAGGGGHQPATAEGRDRLFHRQRDQEPARPQAQPLPQLRPRAVRRRHRSDQGSRRPDRRHHPQGRAGRGMGRAPSRRHDRQRDQEPFIGVVGLAYDGG